MLLAVEALRRVVAGAPGCEVAWIARDGARAVEKCAADRPDLILMDLIMPVMDGVEATCRIMRECPCAILVVTATVEGNADKVFKAMGCGALDAVRTPSLEPDGNVGRGGRDLLEKIALIGRLIGTCPTIERSPRPGAPQTEDDLPPLVAVGSSAGGPEALGKVLGALPAGFAAAVAVIQHINVEFAKGLAEWLGGQTLLPVSLASPDDAPKAGTVAVSDGDRHLVITSKMRFGYIGETRDTPYVPSVDVFFESAARFWPQPGLAVLLTGMGRDGARGLLELNRRGWRTVVQDRATSVVYGMPKAAVDLGAADEILPLPEISSRLERFAEASRRRKAGRPG
jgi:two-component system response regulator WspF